MTATGPYAVAAPRYLEHGWHPLPLPWGKKVRRLPE